MLISYVLEAGLHGHGMDELAPLLARATSRSASRRWPGPARRRRASGTSRWSAATCYAAEDADITLRLYRLLRPAAGREGLLTVYETLERPMPAVLAAWRCDGVRIDPDRLRHSPTTSPCAWPSWRPRRQGWPAGRSTSAAPSRSATCCSARWACRRQEDGHRRVEHRRRRCWRSWPPRAMPCRACCSTGASSPSSRAPTPTPWPGAVAARTGRVHTSFALASTTTGRLSSNDPNLQNIPVRTEEGRKIRAAFIAEPGHVLISADYSQIELRLLAHIGDIPQLKQAFQDGLDIHAMTASEMFGVPVEGMPAETRRRAKAINFGIVYGISAFGLANQLAIPQDEAGAYIRTYFERFPGIRAYMDARAPWCASRGSSPPSSGARSTSR